MHEEKNPLIEILEAWGEFTPSDSTSEATKGGLVIDIRPQTNGVKLHYLGHVLGEQVSGITELSTSNGLPGSPSERYAEVVTESIVEEIFPRIRNLVLNEIEAQYGRML